MNAKILEGKTFEFVEESNCVTHKNFIECRKKGFLRSVYASSKLKKFVDQTCRIEIF
jgi:hypothetical protein